MKTGSYACLFEQPGFLMRSNPESMSSSKIEFPGLPLRKMLISPNDIDRINLVLRTCISYDPYNYSILEVQNT